MQMINSMMVNLINPRITTLCFVHKLIRLPVYVQQVKASEEAPEDVGVLASVMAAVSAPVVAAMSHAESQPPQKVEEKTEEEPAKITAAEQKVFCKNTQLIKPY